MSSVDLQKHFKLTKKDHDPSVISNKPSFAPGFFSAIENENSVLPGPVPESLPTTPGYELEEGGMFSQSRIQMLPLQQPASPSPINEYKATDGFFSIKKASRKGRGRGGGAGNGTGNGNGNASGSGTVSNLASPALSTHSLVDSVGSTSPEPVAQKQMSMASAKLNVYRVAASCCWFFTAGFSDGCLGALLPSIETHYHISYSIVSLLWLGNCIGFILVACTGHWITQRLSLYWLLLAPVLLQIVQYAIISSGTKFPVMVVAYFIGGAALALGLPQHNYYISYFNRASAYLGIVHGTYGIGATCGPLVATLFVSNGIHWNLFFLVLLGFSFINMVGVGTLFRAAEADFAPYMHHSLAEAEEIELHNLTESSTAEGEHSQRPKPKSDFSLAIRAFKTWSLALFVFFYQGAEVGLGSWIVTYLIEYRHGNPNTMGYVSSGFFFGLAVGRLVLTAPASKYIGNRRSITVLCLAGIVLDLIVWQLSNVFGAAFLTAMTGIVVGPIYPLLIDSVGKLVPRKLQVVSMTIMTAFGSSGGAAFPFLIGLLSQIVATWVLHPIAIGLLSAMLLMWLSLPNFERIEKYGAPKSFWQRIW